MDPRSENTMLKLFFSLVLRCGPCGRGLLREPPPSISPKALDQCRIFPFVRQLPSPFGLGVPWDHDPRNSFSKLCWTRALSLLLAARSQMIPRLSPHMRLVAAWVRPGCGWWPSLCTESGFLESVSLRRLGLHVLGSVAAAVWPQACCKACSHARRDHSNLLF